MKLRSGTIIKDETPKSVKSYTTRVKVLIDRYSKNPCSKSMKNLNHIIQIYILTNDDLYNIYKDMNPHEMPRYILVCYKKTLEMMSDLIGKTYTEESKNYNRETKELIVKTIYTMHVSFTTLRKILYEVEVESEYMKNLLKVSKENAGHPIEDKSSDEALAYYCYSHLYRNKEMKGYEIHTYDSGEYTYEEIYDYYFSANINNNLEDDLFIRDDYSRWFIDEEYISHYYINGYKSYTELPLLYDYDELEARIDYHDEELEKYKKMMYDMYPDSVKRSSQYY
jgi:hypothetical protein